MDLWRSEEMQLMQLMLPAEYAFDFVYALGEVGLLQFKDLNADKTAFQRTYANQVKRFEEMARKLRFFREQVEAAGLSVTPLNVFKKLIESDELESKLEELETELLQLNQNDERLQRSLNELLELQLVLERAGSFFDDARLTASSAALEAASTADDGVTAPLLGDEGGRGVPLRLGFVAGTIATDKLFAFERLLFRATRGNMFLKAVAVGAVADPATAEKVDKSVFVVFFSGERARSKMLKICEAFNANRYPLPDSIARQRQMNAEVSGRLRELKTTLETGARYREGMLSTIGGSLESWQTQVFREKAVYHTLNKLSVDVASKVLVAEVWVPTCSMLRVQEALNAATVALAAQVAPVFSPLPSSDMPPTYFRTGELQQQFQNIIDAYGVARYREANPAVFSMVTFPFLFAIMFGDLGHGILMLLFAIYMVANERAMGKQDLGDILGMMFGGRYVILLMAIFSIYTGALYNEFFSMVMSPFGAQHFACPSNHTLNNPVAIHFNHASCPEAFDHGLDFVGPDPYPFGVDPGWKGSTTELSFLNSVKMKMSILLGVAHMDLGVIMSFCNQLYYHDSLSTWCEFIPQMLFLNGMFGYLCFLIVLKWVTGSQADLYHTLIYMFLTPGDVDCGGRCPQNVLYEGQGTVQVVLLLVLLVAVPWMLLPKPLILKKRHEARVAAGYAPLAHDEDDEDKGHGHGHGGQFEFGEVMVHQMIHTIEFVIGAVSNTASYLRLWALSLAHSQLSAVFYDRVLMTGMHAGPAGMFIGFAVFFFATMGVLMVMESLSAFLHALRLHWVEFMNKFYGGEGYQFVPFSFDAAHLGF